MRFIFVFLTVAFLFGCGKSINKVLKNPDPEFKLRMAEKYFVQKKYNKAQVLFEDVMPFYKTRAEFQDI
ncbi:MAG: outer membrane protein assembly factor BamD, partial [Chitinophagaceae bacterium]